MGSETDIQRICFINSCGLFWGTLWHKLERYCSFTFFCFESYLIFFLWINIVNDLKLVAGFTFISFSLRLARNNINTKKAKITVVNNRRPSFMSTNDIKAIWKWNINKEVNEQVNIHILHFLSPQLMHWTHKNRDTHIDGWFSYRMATFRGLKTMAKHST